MLPLRALFGGLISALARETLLEGNQKNAPPDAFVASADEGLMVCAKPQLEYRRKVKVLGVEEPCGNAIAAGHAL